MAGCSSRHVGRGPESATSASISEGGTGDVPRLLGRRAGASYGRSLLTLWPRNAAPSCSVIWLDSAMKVALFTASLATVLRMVTISLAMICGQHSHAGKSLEG